MTDQLKNYINGAWLSTGTGMTAPDINPSDTRDVITQFQMSGPGDMTQAIDGAVESFRFWRRLLPAQRAAYLRSISSIIAADQNTLAAEMSREMGKPIGEARGEVKRTVDIFRYFADEADRMTGRTYPSQRPGVMGFTIRKPLGVIGVITPWNFPLAIPAWKIAPALICGNTVVWKPARNTPLMAVRLAEAFARADIPAGVINVVTGAGDILGKTLVTHPQVRAISFTGSVDVGRRISAMAAEKIMKIQQEMGGKNPTIIAPDAPLEQAADIVINAAYFSAGQKCTATSRVIVHTDVFDRFRDILVDKTRRLKTGSPTDPETIIGPVVDEIQHRRILSYIETGVKEGATLLCGGHRPEDEECRHGHFITPAVFADVQPDMTIAREEIFGPVICLLRAVSMDEALALANDTPYGLSASLITRSLEDTFKYINEIEAGLITVNLPSAGLEYQMPFGGMKNSSSGWREQGDLAIDFYTSLCTVYLKSNLGE